VLLHRFEERCLCLGGGAVDLVGEEHLGKDRPLAEHEVIGIAIEDGDARHVGREKIGSELHALILAAQEAGESFR
jgi:hypothetical protein